MPKYLIERDVPGASNLTPEDLKGIAQKSSAVVEEMGVPYHWVETYVAGDKLYCVHVAPDEATVREHARRGGFPVTKVSEVKAIFDAATADA